MKAQKYTLDEFRTTLYHGAIYMETAVGIKVCFMYYWTDLYGIYFLLKGNHHYSLMSDPIRIRELSKVYQIYSELYDNNLELLQKLEK